MTLLSVLIPARNEMFLARTVQDVLARLRGDTEIVVILDGVGADPPLPEDSRLLIKYHSVSIGQRAATNEAARLARGEFILKLDAHCLLEEGFDLKLTEPYQTGELGPDVTSVPRMYNLHAFDWVCQGCGYRQYQGPSLTQCPQCPGRAWKMEVVWQPRWSRQTDFARFDRDLHFQYWGAYGRRPEAQGDLAEVLCQVGAGWLIRQDRYWELGGLDEAHGSWGQMGVEISCKSWLSGGRQVVNKRTWFAHMFRTQPGFGFPYPLSGGEVDAAREHSRWLWEGGNWPGAKYPLSWLLDRFQPVPDWHVPAQNMAPIPVAQLSVPAEVKSDTVGLIYYTDNRMCATIEKAVQAQLRRCCNGYELISVSLQPLDFGRNLTLPLERGILTMFRQILAGLEASTAETVFLVEHDVLYHPSHFTFRPPQPDVFYYNQNNWKIEVKTGRALFYYCHQTLALCARRELLLEHYRARVQRVAQEGYHYSLGFEPGDHQRPRGVDDHRSASWWSEFPNLDLRHGQNLTPSRWRPEQFRNPKACQGWQEAEEVPGWGVLRGGVEPLLTKLAEEAHG